MEFMFDFKKNFDFIWNFCVNVHALDTNVEDSVRSLDSLGNYKLILQTT